MAFIPAAEERECNYPVLFPDLSNIPISHVHPLHQFDFYKILLRNFYKNLLN